MATHRRYVCQSCGSITPRWAGRCDACGSWNKIVEESRPSPISGMSRRRSLPVKPVTFHALDQNYSPPARLVAGISEFDSVVGGGLVVGSTLLIGGDPGIGKSTLVLQIASRFAEQNRVVYISGEEALDQIRDRALRIGLHVSRLELANVMDVNAIVAALNHDQVPALVVIDSIQTLFLSEIDGSPGTVTQMRASAQRLIDLARGRGFSLILIGHVTKEGFIAGPKLLEHMVDVVLQFEGERNDHFRILRSLKNRFGRSHEIGVFEMTDCGLSEVSNPSRLFLSEDRQSVIGSAVLAGMEGSRPLLIEFQALAAPTGFSTARRAVVGWDSNRLAMILAVIETHCSLSFSGYDVYLNVASGLRVSEPAADMAAAAALLSAREAIPVPAQAVFFGEISLSGSIRPVGHRYLRLREAMKLGFTDAWSPPCTAESSESSESDELTYHAIGSIIALQAGLRQETSLHPGKGKASG